MEKRSVKEMNQVRENAYEALSVHGFVPAHRFIGRGSEGLVYQNNEGTFVVLKVIAKGLEYDGIQDASDFEHKQVQKVEDEKQKALKAEKAKEKKKG